MRERSILAYREYPQPRREAANKNNLQGPIKQKEDTRESELRGGGTLHLPEAISF